jgi:NAD+ synthase
MSPRPADSLAIAIAQLNPTLGDIACNAEKARRARAEAAADGADLVALPELFLSGYPPEDLVLKPALQAACRSKLEELARETADGGPALLIGTPWVENGKLYNSYCLLDRGAIAAVRLKVNLPNYGVFDERRVFAAGPVPGPVSFRGVRLGLPICEDIWTDWGDYENVVECLAETGSELLIVPNGSPYWRNKDEVRLNIAVARVTESDLPLVYVNQIGGQDELVFDGASFGLQPDRSLAFQLPAFREMVKTIRWQRAGDGWRSLDGPIQAVEEGDKADYCACMLGLRDYVNKIGFKGVVLGLSGGIDSALVAALAVDALGSDRVRCLMLPYRFTSPESLADAAGAAKALGVQYEVVPIEPAVLGLEQSLAPVFKGHPRDVTEENLQARARGTILMAISNKLGLMVVTTGNKSEMSVGYATLYGDMNGGFNPIKDLYKTEVYRLARLRNEWKPGDALGPGGPVIPANILTRAPTAELRENQTDQDTLPPYDVLDRILERLVEREEPIAKIVADGFDRETVRKVERMLNLAEYKRRQAAPGVKVTLKNFGRDRRYPIVNRFRDSGAPLPEPDPSLLKAAPAKSEAFDF